MIRLLWTASVEVRHFLRRYMPSNIVLDLLRTRQGLKWGIPAMLLAVPYLAVAQSADQVPASTAPAAPKPSHATTSPSASGSTAGSYTMAEVAKHASAASCWTAIGGKVYDVTAWITQHPGGQRAILGLCGKDGSSAFNAQHGGQGRPAAELKQFLVGTLG